MLRQALTIVAYSIKPLLPGYYPLSLIPWRASWLLDQPGQGLRRCRAIFALLILWIQVIWHRDELSAMIMLLSPAGKLRLNIYVYLSEHLYSRKERANALSYYVIRWYNENEDTNSSLIRSKILLNTADIRSKYDRKYEPVNFKTFLNYLVKGELLKYPQGKCRGRARANVSYNESKW